MNIKEVSLAAYIIPTRVVNGRKEIALICYAPNAYGPIGGRIDDGEDAATALRREIIEELGSAAACIMNDAQKVSAPYKFRVAAARIEKRGALSEEHTFFIAKLPADTELNFIEQRDESGIHIQWLPLSALTDAGVIAPADMREYFAVNIIPEIKRI